MSKEVKGVDTILGLVGEPPLNISIEEKVISICRSLLRALNERHLAFIPYCFKCREPVNWMIPVADDGVMFKCPKCGRTWTILKEEPNE